MWVRPLLPLRKHQLMAQRVGAVAAEQFPERWTASSTLEEATGAVGVIDEALVGATVFLPLSCRSSSRRPTVP
jgi:hypothetical protein